MIRLAMPWVIERYLFTFRFPSAVTPVAQAVITDVVAQEDRAVKQAQLRSMDGLQRFRDAATGSEAQMGGDPWNAAAEAGACAVIDAVLTTLSQLARREHWSADTLRGTVTDLSEQRVVWTYLHQTTKPTSLEEFVNRVDAVIHARPSWAEYQRTVAELAAAANVREAGAVDLELPRPPLTLTQAAQRLGCSGDTLDRMIKANEIRTCTIGKRKRIPHSEVERVLALPSWQWRFDS